jgi:hypothetical protein
MAKTITPAEQLNGIVCLTIFTPRGAERNEYGMHSQLDRRFEYPLGHGLCGRNRQWPHLTMDGAPDAAKPENGGQNLAPRPHGTVLAGTGGCTAYDVVLILKRGRHACRAARQAQRRAC